MYMNKTCVILTTANLTFYDANYGGDLRNCLTKKPDPTATDNAQVGFAILRAFLIGIVLVMIIYQLFVIPAYHRRLVRTLRTMPSHQLHRELEAWYADTLSKKKMKDFREKTEEGGGRFPHVVFSTDRFSKRKTIVITEDLNEQPTGRHVRRYKKRVTATSTISKKATELPSLTVAELGGTSGTVPAVTFSSFGGISTSGVETSNNVPDPQPDTANGAQGAPEIQIDPPPPSYEYRHSWRNHV